MTHHQQASEHGDMLTPFTKKQSLRQSIATSIPGDSRSGHARAVEIGELEGKSRSANLAPHHLYQNTIAAPGTVKPRSPHPAALPA